MSEVTTKQLHIKSNWHVKISRLVFPANRQGALSISVALAARAPGGAAGGVARRGRGRAGGQGGDGVVAAGRERDKAHSIQ